MLCLTRRIGEAIDITAPGGRRITITVINAGRDRVDLGIEAPPEVVIWRRELQEKIDEDNLADLDEMLRGERSTM